MPRCYISLGGNLGDVADTFTRALDRLGQAPGTAVVAVSQYHETRAVGERSGGGFLNAAAAVDTGLLPLDLLDRLQSVEIELGRIRTIRWGPRTLDLDLLFYDDAIIDLPRLVVPHPAAWYRRFVLDPLVEIAPRLVHPVRQVNIETLWNRLMPRPLVVALAGGLPAARTGLIRQLALMFPDVKFVEWEPARQPRAESEGDAALVFWLGDDQQAAIVPAIQFQQLPRVSRIDVTQSPQPAAEFMRHVLPSALG
jgi:2-amino-4-hydroxy-6-hydroxymethyldihydropteridine diphosphokinase